MRKPILSLSLSLLAALTVSAAEIPVSPSTALSAYNDAADGDVLLLEAGAYSGNFTFPDGKTVTLKADAGADVTFAGLFRCNNAASTGGGIILDGLDIAITDSYFISLDNYGDIATITVRNCDIAGINRCFLRTNNTGYKIDEIVFDNCVIHDCGNGGWNFLYPKHIVKSVTTTNSTLYNYAKGESFFFPNATDTANDFTFTFKNNTVYRWGKSNDRALAKVEKKYGANSTYTFTDNIIYKGGADNVTPFIAQASSGRLVASHNLVVDYGDYSVSDKTVDDLSLEGLGMTALSFPDPDGGDFTVVSSSPLASASSTGGIVGDPRWLKVVSNAVSFTAEAMPAEGGSVTPAQASLEAGETVTVTASAAYGFRFKEWQDAEGRTLSADNPYTLTVDNDTRVMAVFSAVDTYTLTVSTTGDGGKWGKVALTPEPVNGVYETGTDVTVKVVPNSVTNFLGWEDGSAETARVVKIDGDKTIEARFDVVPFIVAWDFAVSEPRGNRPADYAFTTDNTGLLNLFNGNGSTTNWGGSTRNFGTGDVNCIRRYTGFADMSNPRSFVARFNAKGYTNVRVHALAAADNDCVHSVQKVQYSADGVNYSDLKSFTIENKNLWADFTVTLPEGLEVVYVRWIGDTSSPLLGSPRDTDTEGFYLADIVVYADQVTVDDNEAPVLLSSSPAAGSESASARGNFVLTFNERIKAGNADVTLNGEILKGVYGSKTVTFPYKGLAYGSPYELVIAPGAITDMAGNEFAGATIAFTTMERPRPEARLFDAVVAKDGSGDFTSVQAAVDAAPEARIAPYIIFVKNGEYEELVRIPKTKPFIHLIGQDKDKTIISFWINNGGQSDIGWEYSTNNPASRTYGYQGVFQVDATDFYTENITFLDSYGVIKQAGPMGLAMRSTNDRQSFNNCKFRSFQDTWFTTTSNVADRHYVNNCWIEGAVDYFYGAGDIYVENTTFYQARQGSVIVAPCHKEGTKFGYVIDHCTLDGPGSQHKLGRAWQNEPMAVFLNTTFKTQFAPEGWSEWHIAPKLFAEYNSTDEAGNPIDLTNRRTEYKVDGQNEKAKRQAILSDEEAARYTYENVICAGDDWNPRKFFEAVDAPANIILDSTGSLSWDASDFAICYIVADENDNVVDITTDTRSVPAVKARSTDSPVYTVKAVNEYGSLSEPGKSRTSGIVNASAPVSVTATTYYNATGLSSDKPFTGFNIIVETLSDGTVRSAKTVVR